MLHKVAMVNCQGHVLGRGALIEQTVSWATGEATQVLERTEEARGGQEYGFWPLRPAGVLLQATMLTLPPIALERSLGQHTLGFFLPPQSPPQPPRTSASKKCLDQPNP